jgi:hypothetical protein
MNRFNAPWGKLLWIMSTLGTVICLGASILLLRTNLPFRVNTLHFWLGILPLVFIIVAALFTVRGYSVSGDTLLVQRLFWSTCLSLAGLQSVEFRPDAVRDSIRTFGNGGFFSFTGYYRNKSLGSYQAFVTDLKRVVVLRFPKGAVILSPDSPEEFVRVLSVYLGSARSSKAPAPVEFYAI